MGLKTVARKPAGLHVGARRATSHSEAANRRGMGKSGMSVSSHELALYAINNRDVYAKNTVPAINCLARHLKRGDYDSVQALILWGHVADQAARRYARDFALPSDWSRIFSVDDRRETAREMSEHYETLIRERGQL